MRQLVSTILVLLVSGMSYGQSGITGTVQDGPSTQALEYATATLKKSSDSTLVTGTITDSTGAFKLMNLPDGSYFLLVDFLGYQTKVISDIQISTETPFHELGTIELTVDNNLEVLEVKGAKSVLENHIDKKVFNADASDVAKGGTGLDMMRTVPLITVDENDNILLRGDGNVTIFIDGRPSAMPASELLKQIPGSSIDKIELITNPSAKYDPEGMSGIINIILKKEKMRGMNGSLSTSVGYGKFIKSNNSLALNYRSDKVNLSANLGYGYHKSWFGGSLNRDVLLGDTLWDRLRQTDYGERENNSFNSKLGLDYFVNDKNTIYINGTANVSDNTGERLVKYRNVDDNGDTVSYSERQGDIFVYPMNTYEINGGWQKSFKKTDHTLDVDLNYSNFQWLSDERLTQNFFNGDSLFELTQYQNTQEKNDFTTYLGKIDYTLPINDSLIFEAGFHYTNRFARSNYYSESATDNGELVPDAHIINDFKYNQATYAPYVTLSKQFKKLGIKGGLRLEQTQTTSELVTNSTLFTNDYLMLFPSIHCNYKLGEFSEIQLSYGKRINRPERDQLNPFTNYSDPLVLETGNPFLLPEVIHVNELSYTRFWKKFNINTSAYYRVINDMIRRNLSYDGAISVVNYKNLGQSSLSGADLILTYTPVAGVRVMSTTNVWNTTTKDTAFTDGTPINLFGVNTSLMIAAQAKKGWSFQLWSSYSPKMYVLQGAIIPNYGGGVAISKNVLNNKGKITASFIDVLKTRRFGFEGYDTDSYSFDSYRRWESRSVYLSFRYSFGKMVQGKSKRELKSNDSSDDITVPDMQ